MSGLSLLAHQAEPRPRAWILDDSPAEAELIRRALAPSCQVEVFTDGAVLIEALTRQPLPDVVVLDWQMPGLSGIDVCQFLRSAPSTVLLPILMLTANQRPEDVAAGMTAGANDYVFKPFNALELSARIHALVRWDLQRKEAQRREEEAHARSLSDEHARRILAEGSLAEVQAAEEAARRSEERYQLATRATRDVIWEWDVASDTREWSANARGVFGHAVDTAGRGLAWWNQHLHPEDRQRVADGVEALLQSRDEEWQDEYRFLRGDGTYAHVLDRGLVVRDARGQPVRMVGAMQDVTERKRFEQAMLRRAEFERQLIGIVSHDLRTPLSAITLSASLLQRSRLDERQAKNVERVLTSAGRASRLIRDLLDFTQARLGEGIPIQRVSSNLHALAQAAVDEAALIVPGRCIELERAGEGSGEWDSDRLGQVLSNLLGNALHYSPPDTPVRVETRTDDEEAVLQVHNRGAPIPAESLARLFEPLERGAERREDDNRSIGLGLFIVDHIVRAHGGSISVRSSLEEGTTFTVRLPRAGPGALRSSPSDSVM